MSGPTLLKKGNLVATKYSPPQSELDERQPLEYVMSWFASRIAKSGKSPLDRILVLESSTGSGKSTVIPPELYHRFAGLTGKSISCTQPKVLTAIEIPKTIVPFHSREYYDREGIGGRTPLKMGENIGYQTGPFSLKPAGGIIFMTVGTLVQQLNTMSDEQLMRKYFIFIIDEAHERDINSDFALYTIKKFIYRNYASPDCPFLMTMSATYDVEKYARYFFPDLPDSERYANIIRIRGFTYPVREVFLAEPCINYLTEVVDKIKQLHTAHPEDFLPVDEVLANLAKFGLPVDWTRDQVIKNQRYRDMLVFVPGLGEIQNIVKKINKLNDSDPFFMKHPVLATKLTGDLVKAMDPIVSIITDRDIKEVTTYSNGKRVPATRRVTISTNVAETGITIDTLKYVIDTGYMKSKEYNPDFGLEMLIVKPITRGMHTQRKGRAGRKFPGECHVMFPEAVLSAMIEDQYPNIVKSEITMDLLNLIVKYYDPDNKSVNLAEFLESEFPKQSSVPSLNIYEMDLLDIPPANNILAALEKLYFIGAIDEQSRPTRLGFIMNKFRFIRAESIKMILAGYAYNVRILDLVVIAAFLSQKSIVEDEFYDERARIFADAKYEGGAKPHKDKKPGKRNLFSLIFKPGASTANDRYNVISTDLINDDFLNILIVYYELERFLTELEDSNAYTSIRDWCEENQVNYSGVIAALEVRDEVLYVLSIMGFNPWVGDHSLSRVMNSGDFEAKIECIQAIKKCIYEGYKANLAVLVDGKYRTLSGLELTGFGHIQSDFHIKLFGDYRPKCFLYENAVLQLNSTAGRYDLVPTYISIPDGIDIDPLFDRM